MTPTRPTWDQHGLSIARLVSERSKDPSWRCGCAIFDPQHRLVSTGYNGFPRGVPDDDAMLADKDVKRALVIHAEENALLFALRSVTGCTAYVWPRPPCSSCASKLAQAGIARVVTIAPTSDQADRWGKSLALAEWVYRQAGIEYEEQEIA